MQKVGCITTFLHSINVTRESNENGRFSARLGLAKLMPGCEIENVCSTGATQLKSTFSLSFVAPFLEVFDPP